MTVRTAQSRGRRATAVAIGAAIGVVLGVVVLINPGLGLFALAGLAVGWLVTEARHRRWRRIATRMAGSVDASGLTKRPRASRWALAIAGLVFGATTVFSILVLSDVHEVSAPDIRELRRVTMSSEMEYRSDKQAFEITDRMVLNDVVMSAICGPDPREQPPEDAASVEPRTASAAGNACARAIEMAGWTFAGNDNGSPTFTRGRQSSVEVPTWPLSVTHSIDTPWASVGPVRIAPSDDSTATIFGPERFIRASSPSASSTESLLDGNEAVTVPMGFNKTFDPRTRSNPAVRLELVGSLGRNPIVAPLLDFSWWGAARWIILLIAAIFQEQMKGLLKWLFGAAAQAVGLRKKPEVASKDTGQAAKAGAAGKAEGGRHRR